MRFLKKMVVSLVMTILILALSMGTVFAEEILTGKRYVTDLFTDVTVSNWFAGPVQQAYTLKLMNGTSQSTFEPYSMMTRAMFVKVLYTMSGEPPVSDAEMPFEDVSSGEWFYDAVCWAYSSQVTSGISPHHFGPSYNVTREQAVQLLYTFSGQPAPEGELTGFEDADAVAPWARDAMVWAVQNGILSGSDEYGFLYLNPQMDLKRGEAAKLLTVFYSFQFGITADASLPEETAINKSNIQTGVKVPALMYHEVSDNVWGLDYLFVSPANMRKQLQWLQNNGYQPIFFSDLTHLWDYQKPVLLTFDDGYEGNYTNLFPLLKEFNMKATIFVVTDEIGQEYRMTPEQLKEMSDSGLVSIQSHTKTHSRLDTLDEQQLITECRESKTVISSITGKSPYALSYPEGRYNTLSTSIVSAYYSFGVRDRSGPWKSSRKTLYSITRVTIPRTFTLTQFAAAVRR